jgi:predicted dehydrogenase
MRLGMIGLGGIAPFYVAAIERVGGAQLAAVCDLNPQKLAQYRSRGIKQFADYRALLETADVDGILLTAPNDQHFSIAKSSLLAGKHVCCEKPLTIHLNEAIELLDLAKSVERTLFTAFHRRYNRNLRRHLRELRDRSAIASVSANYLELIQEHADRDSWYLDPKRCGGGCIADNGPNVFDSLGAFLGPLVVTNSRVTREHGVDLKASMHLLSEDEIPVEVNLDWQYEHGEKKDLTIRRKDDRVISVDFLEGFSEFKGSLWHEYEGVLKDFFAHVERGESETAGCETVRLVEESYAKEVAA